MTAAPVPLHWARRFCRTAPASRGRLGGSLNAGRFAAKAMEPGGGRGQDLEGHVAIERHLPRLLDDAHAAAAEFADNLEITQPPAGRVLGAWLHAGSCMG